MLTGLAHAHKYLGYLTFILAVAGFVLTIAGARTDAGRAALLDKVHRLGMLMSGRLNILLGLGIMALNAAWRPHWGFWAGLVAWGALEPVAKRLVTAEAEAVIGGGQASSKMVIGALIEVVLLTAVVGLMTMSRLGKL